MVLSLWDKRHAALVRVVCINGSWALRSSSPAAEQEAIGCFRNAPSHQWLLKHGKSRSHPCRRVQGGASGEAPHHRGRPGQAHVVLQGGARRAQGSGLRVLLGKRHLEMGAQGQASSMRYSIKLSEWPSQRWIIQALRCAYSRICTGCMRLPTTCCRPEDMRYARVAQALWGGSSYAR